MATWTDQRVRPAPRAVVPPPSPRPQPARSQPRTVLGLIALGALGVVALWWFDTPGVSGFGDWLTNAGRITGLLAGYAVVILLALMARSPSMERGIGTDRLARWHSMGGRYTVSLVVAHALLITWGYAVTAHTNVASQTATLLTSYPDVLMATVAGGLFVLVGAVSARAARARLRYETWYHLHFYTYLAVALAFSHQFAVGADFMTNLPARLLWSALYAGVAALLVWHRFVTPVRQALRHRLRVAAVHREAPGVVSVHITGRHLDELAAEPGQFFRWRFLTRDLWWSSNPYSLSAPASARLLRITVKDLGDHSAALARLAPGTRVFAEGPYGAFTAARRSRPKVLLLGGGVGITPMRALFETLPAGPGDLTLVYRASRPADVVLRRELDAIAARRGAQLHYLLGSRAKLGYDPLDARRLRALVPALAAHDVYLCGPDAMNEAAERWHCRSEQHRSRDQGHWQLGRHPVRPGPGAGHRRQQEDHRRNGAAVPNVHRPRPADQQLRDSGVEVGDAQRAERQHRHGFRRDVHEPWLHQVPAERAGPGRPVSGVAAVPGLLPTGRLPTRHVEHVMGTVVSFDLRDEVAPTVLTDAVEWLHRVDRTFSTYRSDSQISRLDRGDLTAADCDADVRSVLALGSALAEASHGYFTVRPAGRLDPSGVIKGWAIERASDILRAGGSANHAVNGGGDIQLAGEAAPGQPWRVGIAHPHQPGELVTVVSGRDIAVATSGTAELGDHIVNPVTVRPATELASITLVGRDLTTVDAYATAM